MRTAIALSLLCSTGCLGTSTGNPFDPNDSGAGADSAPASDSGPGFDASYDAGAANDGGPASDAGPALDGGPNFDGGPSDAGADGFVMDAGCMDAGVVGCGTTTQPGCDCLAGPPVSLGEGRPLAFVDQDADDGRTTLVRAVIVAGTTTIETIVANDGIVESTTPIVSGLRATSAAARGSAISVVWVEETDVARSLAMSEVTIDTGVATSAATLLTPLSYAVSEIDLARKDATTMVAFVSSTSDDVTDRASVYVLRAPEGGTAPTVHRHVGGTNLRAIALVEAPTGWLLAYADDEAVHTQVLDESGAAVGEPTRVDTSMFVSVAELVPYGAGFALAFDGTGGALHLLDVAGVSTQSLDLGEGRTLDLQVDGDSLALALSENLFCATADSPLLFVRVDSALTPIHESVRIGMGTHAAVAFVDGSAQVAFSSGPALSLADACLPGTPMM